MTVNATEQGLLAPASFQIGGKAVRLSRGCDLAAGISGSGRGRAIYLISSNLIEESTAKVLTPLPIGFSICKIIPSPCVLIEKCELPSCSSGKRRVPNGGTCKSNAPEQISVNAFPATE